MVKYRVRSQPLAPFWEPWGRLQGKTCYFWSRRSIWCLRNVLSLFHRVKKKTLRKCNSLSKPIGRYKGYCWATAPSLKKETRFTFSCPVTSLHPPARHQWWSTVTTLAQTPGAGSGGDGMGNSSGPLPQALLPSPSSGSWAAGHGGRVMCRLGESGMHFESTSWSLECCLRRPGSVASLLQFIYRMQKTNSARWWSFKCIFVNR